MNDEEWAAEKALAELQRTASEFGLDAQTIERCSAAFRAVHAEARATRRRRRLFLVWYAFVVTLTVGIVVAAVFWR